MSAKSVVPLFAIVLVIHSMPFLSLPTWERVRFFFSSIPPIKIILSNYFLPFFYVHCQISSILSSLNLFHIVPCLIFLFFPLNVSKVTFFLAHYFESDVLVLLFSSMHDRPPLETSLSSFPAISGICCSCSSLF